LQNGEVNGIQSPANARFSLGGVSRFWQFFLLGCSISGGFNMGRFICSSLLFLLVVSLVFSSPLLKAQTTPQATNAQFSLIDNRPDKEKKSFYFSMNMFDCNFGVYNLGEKGSVSQEFLSDRVGLLREMFLKKFGDKLNGHVIYIDNFRMIFNASAENKAEAVSQGFRGGIIAPLIASPITTKPKCERAKMTAGWFDPSELTTNNTPVIFALNMKIDGNIISARRVISSQRNMFRGFFIELPTPDERRRYREAAEAVCDDATVAAAPFLS
jgi:hypothetical protein